MSKKLKPVVLGCLALVLATPSFAQVKQSREQMIFYTSEWKGERFPDGRPRIPDDLLKRVVDVSVEDLWDYLRDKGFNCQFDTGFQMLAGAMGRNTSETVSSTTWTAACVRAFERPPSQCAYPYPASSAI